MQIANSIIWGNHSSTQYPDISHATINGANSTARFFMARVEPRNLILFNGIVLFSGKPAKEVITDDDWYKSTFIPAIQVRDVALLDRNMLLYLLLYSLLWMSRSAVLPSLRPGSFRQRSPPPRFPLPTGFLSYSITLVTTRNYGGCALVA
jgi:hypothetical protein